MTVADAVDQVCDAAILPPGHRHENTYTFHVGPIAELEVRDGGASRDATPEQVAFTVAANNNGPDFEYVGGRWWWSCLMRRPGL